MKWQQITNTIFHCAAARLASHSLTSRILCSLHLAARSLIHLVDCKFSPFNLCGVLYATSTKCININSFNLLPNNLLGHDIYFAMRKSMWNVFGKFRSAARTAPLPEKKRKYSSGQQQQCSVRFTQTDNDHWPMSFQ